MISAWVRRWSHLVSPGSRALDLACGSGRHVRFLASLGADVLAVDRDAGALEPLAGVPSVKVLCCDLESDKWPLSNQRFDVIIVTNYLYRPHFPALFEALAPEGVLIFETFALGQASFGRLRNPAFLLRSGELLTLCAGQHILAYEDGIQTGQTRCRVQRIVVVNSPHADDRILLGQD
jgi:SAM-dependent methyltransferase